jgi:hypothetical protein
VPRVGAPNVNVGMRPRWDPSDAPRDSSERDGLDAIVQFLSWLVTGALGRGEDDHRRRPPWRPFRRSRRA